LAISLINLATCQYKNEGYDFTCDELARDTDNRFCIFQIITHPLKYYNITMKDTLLIAWLLRQTTIVTRPLPLSASSCHTFSGPIFPYNSIWLVEIYVGGCIPKILLVKPHYGNGNKYCRRCEVYFFHDGIFCPFVGWHEYYTRYRPSLQHRSLLKNLNNSLTRLFTTLKTSI
jgi:hypothetical protein